MSSALIKIWSIAWKDLRSTMRNVPALVMMLVAPLALAGLLGLAFGGGQSFSISAIKVAVANQDQAVAGGQNLGSTVADVLTSRDLKDVLSATAVRDAGAARARVDDGKAAVAVVIPPGFSAAVYGNQGQQAPVELYENPTDTLGSSITSAVVDHTLIDLNGARAAAVAAAAAGGGSGHEAAARAAAARFISSGGVSRALTVAQRSPTAKGHQTSTVGLVLAGMMVFFTLFGASNVARTILTEDRGGTLPRLLTTPTSPSVILGGKFGSVFLTVIVQIAVLLVAGALIFGIHWGGPVSVVVLTV
ncbi:MAG TPA: ABC transporter permease, partial [Thermoleophilia bacterium]|nr:ABC transporter permease [Thermoleophilia bacterium]